MTVDNKLQSILAEDVFGFPYGDLTCGQQLIVIDAIAAIKRSFLEMESMQDEEAETLNHGVCNLSCHAISRQLTRQAIRKEINHE